jgi:two-component system sensor histidine kinase MprB
VNLRNRIALAGGSVVLGALLLASLILYSAVNSNLHDQLEVSLIRSAADAPKILDQAKQKTSQGSAPAGLTGLMTVGNSVLQFVPAPVAEGATDGFIPVTRRDVDVALQRQQPYFQDAVYQGTAYRVYSTSVPADAGSLVRVARPLSDATGTLHRLQVLLVVLVLGGGLLAAVITRLAAGRVLRPVRELTEVIEHVTATQELTARIDAPGRDEISRLARSFTVMMAALNQSVLAQQRLVADASHELRTPLTSLTTDLDLLAEGRGLADPIAPELVAAARAQAERLKVLVNSLLDLARYAAAAEAHTEDLRLDLLAVQESERAARCAPGLRFETEVEEVLVHGDPDAIERAIANLLDNAVKWSPPGGRIRIHVAAGQITVSDEGPGIPEADIPYIFDRFYRSTAGRSQPGSGLGLAIVRQIAETHGGTITVQPQQHGACLRLSLTPVA